MAKPSSIKAVSAQHKHTRVGIYGDPGCGKTTFAGSKGKGTIIIRPPIDHTDSIIGSGADEWVANSWHEMDEVLDYARTEGYKEYEWWWLDSASLMQDVTMDDIWQAVIAEKPHRAKNYYDKGEYRINMGRMSEWFRYMIGCDLFHFGFTAHPFWMYYREDNEGGDDVQRLMPWIQGKQMPQKLSGMMQLVGYMDVRTVKGGGERRRIRFHGNENFYAKDAFNCIPNGVMLDPTLPKLEAAVAAARAGKSGARPQTRKRTVIKRSKS